MKFFKWLSKSRETVWLPPKFVGHIHLNGSECVNGHCDYELKPSPTTLYPPIEEKDK